MFTCPSLPPHPRSKYPIMKISIITATYNSEKTLEDTILSVLAQDYTDFEHIIVDGKSKDSTIEIVKRYEERYNGRLRFISESDKGLYDAMNKGIRMAEGDIIGILNSDDFYSSSNILSNIISQLQGTNIDAIYGDVHYVNPDNLKRNVRYYSSRIFSRSLMRLGFMPAHPSFYCRREVYQKYGLFDTTFPVAADFEHLLRLIYINRIRLKYIKKDFVTMRTGGTSNASMASRMAIMHDHQKALKKNKVYSNQFLLSLRYIYKMLEIGVSPFRTIPDFPTYIRTQQA